MDVAAAARPQLDYAPQPAVGDVTLTRADGVTIVTRRPSWRRVGIALLPLGAALAVAALVLAGTYVKPLSKAIAAADVPWAGWIVVVVGVAGSVRPLVVAANPIRWTVTPDGIELTLRRPMQVVHEAYPRAGIADVRVERVRVKDQLFKRLALVTLNPAGGRLVHLRGRRAELAFVAEAFRDGLGLAPDPFGEAAFPPPPRWGRVQRRIGLRSVGVTLRPPRLGRPGAVIILGVLDAAGVAAAALSRMPESRLPLDASSLWGLLLLATVGVACGLLAAVHHLRRRVTIDLTPSGLTLTERSLIRPARASWPIARVASLATTDRSGGRRADLWITLQSGAVEPLIQNGPGPEVRFVYQTLSVALQRIRPVPVG